MTFQEDGVPGPIQDKVRAWTPTNTKIANSLCPVWRSFWDFFPIFGEVFFHVFFLTLFFSSRVMLRRPKSHKGCQKEIQSKQKGCLKPPWGPHEKHGIYCTGATLRPPREGPGTTFLKSALRRGLHRVPERGFGRFVWIWVRFRVGGPWGANFR